jgi:hypothetical protein
VSEFELSGPSNFTHESITQAREFASFTTRVFPESSFGSSNGLGFWNVAETSRGSKVGIGIVFKTDQESLMKLLPEFIQKLKVPLVAIAGASDNKLLLFKN